MADVKFSIVRHIGVICGRGNGWSREVNLVKWNDMDAKVDIRDWSPDRTSMRKGLTFNRQEFYTLMKLLKDIKGNEILDGTAIPAKQVDVKKEQDNASKGVPNAVESVLNDPNGTTISEVVDSAENDTSKSNNIVEFSQNAEEQKNAACE